MKKKSLSKYIDQEKLQIISSETIDKIEELLEILEIEHIITNKMIYGCCPIHGGDNASALNLYHTGHSYRGNWACRTHHCEKVFKSTIIGFVRGVLSHKKYDWQKEGDKVIGFGEAVRFLENFTKQDYDSLSVDYEEIEKRRFIDKLKQLRISGRPEIKNRITRSDVRKRLEIPCQYYIERGYDPEVLDRYDVGLCSDKSKPMYGRSVVPIYDDDYKFVVGCTGRATTKDHNCKWKHSFGFDADSYLYNYWNAKDFILKTRTVILVEGPGDVWKLEENDIHNSVAMFGTYLSASQKSIIDNSGAMSVVVLTDGDEAGRIGAESIYRQCSKIYRVYFPTLADGDVGDMKKDVITSDIQPMLEKIQEIEA